MAARMEAGHREEAPSDAGSNSIQELQDRALVGVRRVAYAFGEAGIVCANVASTREGTPEGGVLKVFGLVLLGEPPVVPSLTHEHRSPGRGACASLRLGLNVVPNPVVHLLLNPETNDGSLRAHSSSDRPELCRTQVRTRCASWSPRGGYDRKCGSGRAWTCSGCRTPRRTGTVRGRWRRGRPATAEAGKHAPKGRIQGTVGLSRIEGTRLKGKQSRARPCRNPVRRGEVDLVSTLEPPRRVGPPREHSLRVCQNPSRTRPPSGRSRRRRVEALVSP
eukprot:1180526-Prorocentrum_minimum.AAC.1